MFETTTAGGYGQSEWQQGEWNQGEGEWGRRRRRWRHRRRWDNDDDDEFGLAAEQEDEDAGEQEDEDAGEEQFLPIIAAGLKLLPTILGSLASGGRRQGELMEGEDG